MPAILSLRHFESQSDQRRFVTDFARRLYHRKGEEGRDTPMLLAIDEAHLFVPQRVSGAEAQMVGAIQKLVRQGRTSGIGVAIIDQRAASVNKDVLTQLELLICHRTSSPQDRKALEAWIEQHDKNDQKGEFLRRLPELARGVAWCWSPGWLDIFKEVPIRARRTFDSSATPKAGEVRVTPTTLAKIDLDALKTRMAAAIEKASRDDPKALRTELDRVKKQLVDAQKGKIARRAGRSPDTHRGAGTDGEARGDVRFTRERVRDGKEDEWRRARRCPKDERRDHRESRASDSSECGAEGTIGCASLVRSATLGKMVSSVSRGIPAHE